MASARALAVLTPPQPPCTVLQIVSFIREWREKNDEFSGIAKALVEHCIGSLAGVF